MKIELFSIEVLRAHSVIKTEFSEDKPEVGINIRLFCQINEVPDKSTTPIKELTKQLERRTEDYVKAEAETALKYAQANGFDIFDIGDKIYHQHPYKWKTIENDWRSIFSEVNITINVEATIKGTGMISKN